MREPLGKRPEEATYTYVSVTGKRVVHVAKQGPLTVDGKPDVAADSVQGVELSRDGKTLAYYAVRGKHAHLIINGQQRAVMEEPSAFPPLIDSGRVVCTGKSSGGWWIFVDGERRYGPFADDARAHGDRSPYLALRPGDGAVAYVAVHGETMRFEIAGTQAGKPYEVVRDPTFSRDGTRYAFRAVRDDKWVIVLDGTEYGPFDDSEKPVFASDGRLWFSAGDDDQHALYADGEIVESHVNIKRLVLAADVPRRAVVARDAKRKYAIVVDGEPRAKSLNNVLGLHVTADGEHWAAVHDRGSQGDVIVDGAVTHKGVKSIDESSLVLAGAMPAFHVNTNKAFVQVGEHKTAPFDALWSELVVLGDGRVAFIADKGGDMFLEEV